MNRITEKDLQAVCDRINRATGNPLETYTKTTHPDTGSVKYTPNIGNYHLQAAYGGWGLIQMMGESGGVRSIIGGYRPKRELYEMMHAYLNGVEAKQTVAA